MDTEKTENYVLNNLEALEKEAARAEIAKRFGVSLEALEKEVERAEDAEIAEIVRERIKNGPATESMYDIAKRLGMSNLEDFR